MGTDFLWKIALAKSLPVLITALTAAIATVGLTNFGFSVDGTKVCVDLGLLIPTVIGAVIGPVLNNVRKNAGKR